MPKSYEQLKQEYINSLDSFIAQNPTVGQLDTSKFRDFFIGLVGHESSYNPTARQGSYFGYYQTKDGNVDPYHQHLNAFNHLNGLFNNTITKEDILKARQLGINDSALMLKYWNQGNRVNNYIWNNKDSADGLGTKISVYGNDLTMPLDVYGYAMDNLYGNYTVKQGDNWFDIQKRVRIPGRNYVTAGKDLWDMQQLIGRPYGSLRIGQSFTFGDGPQERYERSTRIIDSELNNKIKALLDLSNRINYANRTEYLTRYQKGGNLTYDPFIQKEKTSYKQQDFDYRDFNINNKFPIEPVVVYKPSNIEYNEPTIQQVQEEYQPAPLIPKGVVEYKSKDIDVGNMQELIDLMKDEGISFRITSGNRPGALTKQGKPSHHSSGNALDITPIQGQTWEDLINQMKKSKRFIAYMKEHKLGILDERTKEMLAKTGGTGAHFHIGPDLKAVANFNLMMNV